MHRPHIPRTGNTYTKSRPTSSPLAEVFEAVQRGDADFGVVPFENSTNGPVIFTLDNLANRYGTCPDISVCGEAYVDVHHYLLGHKSHAPTSSLLDDSAGGSGAATPTASDPNPLRPRTKPLSGLRHVQRLYSHPQAWGQCSVFLSTYLRGVETIDVSSTSRAAEMVKEDPTGCSAAISSEIAAKVYGLDVLAKCIEDREDNTTRFFILRKTSRPGLEVPAPGPSVGPAKGTKSLVSFTVPHREPGALADVLDCFRKKGLNLTSINSRPSLLEAFQYLFFVEIEGHYDHDAEVREAYEAVEGVAQTSRWLGSWYSRRA